MNRQAPILAALLLAASAAHGFNAGGVIAALMGSASDKTAIPSRGLAANFSAADGAVTTDLNTLAGRGPSAGDVATFSGDPYLSTAADGKKGIIRNPGDSPWAGVFTNGVPVSTNMSVGFVFTRASGELSTSFGRSAGTAVPYGCFGYSDNNWNAFGKYFGVSNIVGRCAMLATVEGTNLTIRVCNWEPAGQSLTFAAGTLDQIGRIGSGVYHKNLWHEGAIWTNALTEPEEDQFFQYSHEEWSTPAP